MSSGSSSNTWEEIQSVRNKSSSLKEKLAKRRAERQNILNTATADSSAKTPSDQKSDKQPTDRQTTQSAKPADTVRVAAAEVSETPIKNKLSQEDQDSIERCLLLEFDLPDHKLPLDSVTLSEHVLRETKISHSLSDITPIILTFESQNLIVTDHKNDDSLKVLSMNHEKIEKVIKEKGFSRKRNLSKSESERQEEDEKKPKTEDKLNIEMLLASETAKERETKKMNEEIQDLLNAASTKEQMMSSKFKSQGGTMKEFCSYGTRAECRQILRTTCDKVHFRKLIHQHTDQALGDCSFLNTCFHMDTCKYVHYEVDQDDLNRIKRATMSAAISSLKSKEQSDFKMMPSQWVQCDLRNFDMTVLGKFAVIMADPPWDIHMELPYGTMSDDEMRSLNIPTLQDDGYIFLWVTGRAMELGRECLAFWGYKRCDELIWVKTNQLQKLIRTGRTGHWINHGKEHCLVGVKGNPQHLNRGIDCDVIVAEVRATSHKPDEVYGLIERLSPGTRKIELFGRPHNVQPNWLTLGNQCDGVQIHEDDVKRSFQKRYPDGKCV